MRASPILLVAAAMLALAPAPAPAQQAAPVREGLWLSLGVAWGLRSTAACCPTCCEGGVASEPSGALQVGATFGRHLLVGFEADGFQRHEPVVSEDLVYWTAAAFWYPWSARTFFLKGGLGYYRYDLDDAGAAGGAVAAHASGLAAVLGLGLDVYLGRDFSLTPFLNVATGLTSGAAGPRPTLLQAGVSAVLH